MTKIQLSKLVVSQGFAPSVEKAKALILAGHILVNDYPVTKAGTFVDSQSDIRSKYHDGKYVSRGGNKLEGALSSLGIAIAGKTALDIGQSSGGFTDCLLRHGIAHVIGVDVAYGMLDYKIRQDKRVSFLERTNARYLDQAMLAKVTSQYDDVSQLLSNIDIVVMDVSFISVLKVLPAILPLVLSNTDFLILIKPQFEAPKDKIGSGGIIRDEGVIRDVLTTLEVKLLQIGLVLIQKCPSPITGRKGNQEFFFHLKSNS
ncbi:MAG: TlyA family RNA methyltransferase [Candidatus Margulisbacteria bacterium]|nr:TlyA family RNA methyltransferase [Candidatus Margulisiibacteriota bacterium]